MERDDRDRAGGQSSRRLSNPSEHARSPSRGQGGAYNHLGGGSSSSGLPRRPHFDSRDSSPSASTRDSHSSRRDDYGASSRSDRHSRYDDYDDYDYRRRRSPPSSSSRRRSPSPRRRSPGPSHRRRSPSPPPYRSSSSSYRSSSSRTKSRFDELPSGPSGSSSSSGRRTSLTAAEKMPYTSALNGSSSRPSTSSSSYHHTRPSSSSTSNRGRRSSFDALPAFFYKPLDAKDFRVLYDPALDPGPIKKGKEVLERFDGEGVASEGVKDPRRSEDPVEVAKMEKRRAKGPLMRQVAVVSYSWDKNSTGPPPPAPPCAILVTNFPSTVTADAIHAHFRVYGRIETQDVKHDARTGGSLGICWIKFVEDVPRDAEPDKAAREKYERKKREGRAQDGGEAARAAVGRGNGSKIGIAMLMGDQGVKVEFDADGSKCKAAVKAEMDRRHPPKPEPPLPSSAPPAPPNQLPPPPPSVAPPPPPSRPPLPPQAALYGPRSSRFGPPTAQSSSVANPPSGPSPSLNGPRFAAQPGRGPRGGAAPPLGPRTLSGGNPALHVSVPSISIPPLPSSSSSTTPSVSRADIATHVSVPAMAIPPLPPRRPLPVSVPSSSTSTGTGGGKPSSPVQDRGGRSSSTAPGPPVQFARGGRRGGRSAAGNPPRADSMASAIAQAVEAAKKRLKMKQEKGPQFAPLPSAGHRGMGAGRGARVGLGGGAGAGGRGGKEEGEADMELDSDDEEEARRRRSESGSAGLRSGTEGEEESEEEEDEEEEEDAKDAVFIHHASGGPGRHAAHAEPRRILARGMAPVGAIAWQASKKVLLEKLAANGRPYLKIEKEGYQKQREEGGVKGQGQKRGGRLAVPSAEELERRFRKYEIDRTFADSEGWYITFKTSSAASTALDEQNHRKFSGAPLNLVLCDPPSTAPTPTPSSSTPAAAPSPVSRPSSSRPTHAPAPGSHLAALVEKFSRRPTPTQPKKTSGWTDAELVAEAKELVVAELLEAFQNDLKIRLVRGKVQEHLQRWEQGGAEQQQLRRDSMGGTTARVKPEPLPPGFPLVKTEPGASPANGFSPLPPPPTASTSASTSSSAPLKSLSSLSFSKRKSAQSSSGAAHGDDRDRRRRGSTSTRLSSEAPSTHDTSDGEHHHAHSHRRKEKNGIASKKHREREKERKQVSRSYSDTEESSAGEEREKGRSKKKISSASEAVAMGRKRKEMKEARARKRVSVDYTSSEEEEEVGGKKRNGLAQVKEEEGDSATASPAPSAAQGEEEELVDFSAFRNPKKKKERRNDAMDVDHDDQDEVKRASSPELGGVVNVKKNKKLVCAGEKKEKEKKPKQEIPIPTSFDPFEAGLATDEEDLFYLKLALERLQLGQDLHPTPPPSDNESADKPPPKHPSGSARSEGFYKITVEEKLANRPAASNKAKVPEAAAGTSSVAVSRLARANTRGLVRGMELHKKVTATDTDVLKFNQLKTRKKQLTFSRSGIEGYGLFAVEFIPAGDMVIEYVGELIRQQVADRREKAYERQGIGSSYLFRVDEDLVVDATKKGNLGRLINHCCAPNCTARIITINGVKKIVIYAKANIHPGEEVTYDYHFPIEEDKVVCLCGHPLCRGYLN
ncbi:hypothetical protein JCM8547_001597 [Rhodosporidiobolus lusitaniae]